MGKQLSFGDLRQVHVNPLDLGIAYLPVMPYCGELRNGWRIEPSVTHAVTQVENGTIIRFIEVLNGMHENDQVWVFALKSTPCIHFLVPSVFAEYLWRFKMMPTRKLR